MAWRISITTDVDDKSKLETAATSKLQTVGKSTSEIKEILYDGDDFQTLNALVVMTGFWSGWEGCTITRTEGEEI